MILRALHDPASAFASSPEPANQVFLQTQKHVPPPYAIILQAEHSNLAGGLAELLSPDLFGDLPPEVIQAAREHDLGWTDKDREQIENQKRQSPKPFPALSAADTLPSWQRSIEHAASVGPLVEVLISRHFCNLGRNDPERAEFVAKENDRRAAMEDVLPFPVVDLDRWTAAIGFTDLLSLYLCSGSHDPVIFPLTHPASAGADRAPDVTLTWEEGESFRFSSPVFAKSTQLSMDVRRYEGDGGELTPLTLEWKPIA